MATKSEWRFTRTEAAAPNAMVTADPLPAEAGLEILQAGGNALDAALSFPMTVSSPRINPKTALLAST